MLLCHDKIKPHRKKENQLKNSYCSRYGPNTKTISTICTVSACGKTEKFLHGRTKPILKQTNISITGRLHVSRWPNGGIHPDGLMTPFT
ncbi:hypothetical protein OUZ56_012581 [Daphnia magna]|uniref:Uncharacterized protein n=1 Tax=Daphnia magna TaxID=35525 RepID=A0ABQ9Z3G2_9CRUS|nr:hypothetical protein OUZ56_012581 [Daphnia magna]